MIASGTLTPAEIVLAGLAGLMRLASAVAHKRPSPHGQPKPEDRVEVDLNGVYAEMVVAKHLGRYWQPLADNGHIATLEGDVGPGVQVRSTTNENGCLIVYRKDNDHDRFYLVTLDFPKYTIVGWISGSDAKRPEFWRDDAAVRSPAFFVPQARLYDGEVLF